jgi:hypothetical protein
MKLQKFNRTLLGAMLISSVMGVASQAHALTLSPGMETWTSLSTSNLGQAAVEAIVGVSPLGLVYKQDEGGSESGNGMGYYTTAFTYESMGDATGATITWDGGMKVSCPDCFLIVKDGNHSQNPPPYPQYIFDISGWNGTDTITLSGFWPGPGAISNVAIWNNAYDGGGSLVPEADTYAMLLAGLGLVGFAARRKLA